MKGAQLRTVEADTSGCRDCKHHQVTTLFELCGHEKAAYSIGGRTDQHTLSHMRDVHVGQCGEKMGLFEKPPAEKRVR